MTKRTSQPPAAQPSAQGGEPKPSSSPFVAEYYYTARWGYADEFIRLFKKNHWPVLKRQSSEVGRARRGTSANG